MMSRLCTFACAISLCAVPAAATLGESALPQAGDLAQWGSDVLRCIERDFLVNGRGGGYFAEEYSERARRRQPAYMWSSGVHLSALVAAANYDREGYGDDLIARIESLEPYWTTHGGVGGYDVLPRPSASDRYYDDNAWIALALLEAYRTSGEKAHLHRAREIYEFLLSGEDDKLGGGIYWREKEKSSKNTCINAPAALVALMLHEATGEPQYLETGRRLYNWTRTKLQDRQSGLYWDNIDLEGKIDRRQFTYNSAVMIRAAVKLHTLIGDQSHLREAKRVADASIIRWIDQKTGAVRDGGQFAHMLLDALLELSAIEGDPQPTEVVLRCAAHVHGALRDENGRYPRSWDEPRPSRRRGYELIHQASAARLFFSAANAVRE